MKQLISFADERLAGACIYCGGLPDTRDHVPSKCLLDRPFPENLPIVDCCNECNQSFSRDEQYLACLLKSVLCGSTNPEEIRRESVAKIMSRVPSLKMRIESSKTEVDGMIAFIPEIERINNVMLKLARGHAAFELSQTCYEEPNHLWCGLISSLSQENQQAFNSAHFPQTFGEVGSRNMQRFLVTEMPFQTEDGEKKHAIFIVNDWVNVQDDQYRYIAIDDVGEVIIRIVISEYLACEVIWEL